MIKRIDAMLKLWAEELHNPREGTIGGSNMIAMLMECKGDLIRGTRGARVLLDESADIELIVNKHLEAPLALVVREHYCNLDSFITQKALHCGCSVKAYYRRLHDAQACIASLLRRKAT